MNTTPHCILFGATGGIGGPLLDRLLARGWRVTAVSRHSLRSTHPRLESRICDLVDRAAVERLAVSLGAPVDRLVFAQGVFRSGAAQVANGELQHVVNATAVRWFCDALLTPPKRTVFVGSDAWKRAQLHEIDNSTGLTAYRASKRALFLYGLTLARRGWEVHTVHPGVVRTPIADAAVWWVRWAYRLLQALVGVRPDQAAANVERLVVEPELAPPSGTYWYEREPQPEVVAAWDSESRLLEQRWVA